MSKYTSVITPKSKPSHQTPDQSPPPGPAIPSLPRSPQTARGARERAPELDLHVLNARKEVTLAWILSDM